MIQLTFIKKKNLATRFSTQLNFINVPTRFFMAKVSQLDGIETQQSGSHIVPLESY